MKVLRAKVNWMERYSNLPYLQLLVDEKPPQEDLRYQFHKEAGLYYAEDGGYVSFFHYHKPGEGYGGALFPIIMVDGSLMKLKGPWSSRAGCINLYTDLQCLDVNITDNEKAFDQGYTFYSGAITLELAMEAIRKCGGCQLLKCTESSGEIVYVPAKVPARTTFVELAGATEINTSGADNYDTRTHSRNPEGSSDEMNFK